MRNQNSNGPIRSFLSALLLLTLSTIAVADRVTYSYDASGNRTSSLREIVYTRGSSTSKSAQSKKFLDSLSLARISIYPNPTEGDLRIEISGIENCDDTELTVHSLGGSILEHIQPLDVTNEIDLSGYTDGIYLVVIRIKEQTTTWKIIKK
jgi:hypothetical protein